MQFICEKLPLFQIHVETTQIVLMVLNLRTIDIESSFPNTPNELIWINLRTILLENEGAFIMFCIKTII